MNIDMKYMNHIRMDPTSPRRCLSTFTESQG